MDRDFWYRCMKCGYLYTPQQFQALVQLHASHSGQSESTLMGAPEQVPCRNRGCEGRLIRTETRFREAR
jgi:hypothetical protein